MSQEEFRCRAINDYYASVTDELDLKEGAEYTVMQTSPSGWWYAVNDDGEDGWVPSNYLVRLDDDNNEQGDDNNDEKENEENDKQEDDNNDENEENENEDENYDNKTEVTEKPKTQKFEKTTIVVQQSNYEDIDDKTYAPDKPSYVFLFLCLFILLFDYDSFFFSQKYSN